MTNKDIKEWIECVKLDEYYDFDTLDRACVVELTEELLRLREFVESISTNYDCDTDGHKYGTYCRKCEAEKLIEKYGE